MKYLVHLQFAPRKINGLQYNSSQITDSSTSNTNVGIRLAHHSSEFGVIEFEVLSMRLHKNILPCLQKDDHFQRCDLQDSVNLEWIRMGLRPHLTRNFWPWTVGGLYCPWRPRDSMGQRWLYWSHRKLFTDECATKPFGQASFTAKRKEKRLEMGHRGVLNYTTTRWIPDLYKPLKTLQFVCGSISLPWSPITEVSLSLRHDARGCPAAICRWQALPSICSSTTCCEVNTGRSRKG